MIEKSLAVDRNENQIKDPRQSGDWQPRLRSQRLRKAGRFWWYDRKKWQRNGDWAQAK